MDIIKNFGEELEKTGKKLFEGNEDFEVLTTFIPHFMELSFNQSLQSISLFNNLQEAVVYEGRNLQEACEVLAEEGLIWNIVEAKKDMIREVYIIHDVMFLDLKQAETLCDGKESPYPAYIDMKKGEDFESGINEMLTYGDLGDILAEYEDEEHYIKQKAITDVLKFYSEKIQVDPYYEVTVRNLDWSNVELKDLDLSAIHLVNVNLSGSSLSNVNLTHAHLNGVNLNSATLRDVQLSKVTFENVEIDGVVHNTGVDEEEERTSELLSLSETHTLELLKILGYEDKDLLPEEVDWEEVKELLISTFRKLSEADINQE